MNNSLDRITLLRAMSSTKALCGRQGLGSSQRSSHTVAQTIIFSNNHISKSLFELPIQQRLLQPGPQREHLRRPVRLPVAAATTSSDQGKTVQRIATDYGFGFSAGGLLFPYFLGVAVQLQAMNVLRPETPVAGASAGSIVAVCTKSGLSEQQLLDAFVDLSRDCRQGGTRTRLKSVLQRVLQEALPYDIHERCEGRVFLAVTRLFPDFAPLTVSSFTSRQDVIDTLLVSSHIPYWFDGSLFTSYRDGMYFDGGITNFIPSTPTALCHRVCCFPSEKLRAFPNIDLSPDTYEAWPYDMGTMLSWAFEPAPDETLMFLVEKGKRDARSWAIANVPELVLV